MLLLGLKDFNTLIIGRIFVRLQIVSYLGLWTSRQNTVFIGLLFFETSHTSGKLLSKAKDTDVVLIFITAGVKMKIFM